MISGQQAFGGMSTTLARERAALDDMEMQLTSIRSQIEELHRLDLEDLRALAALHLDDVAAGEVVGRLSRAEKEAQDILRSRAEEQRGLLKEIEASNQALESLHREREDAQARIEAIEDAIADAEAKTLARIKDDAEYSAQSEQARLSDIRAANAEEKADQSAQELAEKGKAYLDSPLFSYLWERKYGLPGYRAFPLFRYLDGRVARLIGYTDARLNFTRLSELPERLAEHAKSLAESSDEEDAKLEKLWVVARADDMITAMDGDLEVAENALEKINTDISEAQGNLESFQAKRHAGNDETTRKAIDILTKALRRKDIDDLWDDARDTLRPEDDTIVSRILAREDERERLEDLAEDINDKFDRRHNRLEDFGGMLGKFQRKYTKSSSGFLDGPIIAILVKEFLEGVLDVDDWWEGIERQHTRRREKPSSNRGPWGGSKRKRKSWPSGSRRSGSFSGGFRTGGGFRSSGGFRTGGGI